MSCIRRHVAEFGAPEEHCKHLIPSFGSNMAERAISDVLWRRQDAFVNKSVCHYTNIETLRALLRPGSKLLCTDFRNLNDTSEFIVGFDVVLATLRKVFGLRRYHEVWLRKRFDAFRSDGVHGPWVMSFTENENDLYQWAAYSDRKLGGCAIGFDFEALFDFAASYRGAENAMVETYLGPCVYAQNNEVVFDHFLCGCHREGFMRLAATSATNLRCQGVEILGDAWNDMMILFALIKHPCFSIEREWRFVALPQWTARAKDFKNIVLVGGKRRIAFPFKRSMIRSVTVSPHGDVASNRKRINGIIRMYRANAVEIRQSELPYRGDCLAVKHEYGERGV